MIREVSRELFEKNIFHKKEGKLIKTRRSIVTIPPPNKDIDYLLGVIAGDGSLNMAKRKRGGNHYLLRIYSGKKKYLNYLKRLFKKLFGIDGKVRRDLRKKNLYYFNLENAPIFFYFAILGSEVGKKKRGKLPKRILKKETNFLEYLAGLVDTDGNICGKRIQLKQKSYKLLKKIFERLKKLDFNCARPKINYTNGVPFYYIRFDNKLPLRLKVFKR